MALYGLSQSVTYGVAFRVRGTMDSKMTFAGLLMLVDLMTLAHVLYRPYRHQLRWGIPALFLITAALLMTHTRSAWCGLLDRKSTRLNSSHLGISYAVFCLK